jgi:hypothetical protein
MFPVYGGKCLSLKAIHNWVKNFSEGPSKVADDTRPGAEVAETTIKRLLCCGFRRTGKSMGQVYQCLWRICREISVLPRLEFHVFYVLYPFVTFALTLPHIKQFSNCRYLDLPSREQGADVVIILVFHILSQ